MAETVLFVDDEPQVRQALQRLDLDGVWHSAFAADGAEALEYMEHTPVAALVSDYRMPGIDGLELLSRAGRQWPDTAKILLTAHADLEVAVEAVNSGDVFRILLKPWDNDKLIQAISEGLTRYRLAASVKTGDDSTLLSLAQMIELKDAYTRGHCERVADYAGMIAERLRLDEKQQSRIRHGAWLHDCGKIGVPEAILNYQGPLNGYEFDIIKNHPVWGAAVARQARFSATVVNIIRHHHERWDGTGYPLELAGRQIPLEARIVAVADTFDALTSDRPYRRRMNRKKALDIMISLRGAQLDPFLTDIFLERIKHHELRS